MPRRRRQKEQQPHYCILVNEKARCYRPGPIERLTGAIRSENGRFTVLRPKSAVELIEAARAACGLKANRRLLPPAMERRGKVTGLVACGGDGTLNLVARAALEADIPLGALPMGRFNNIGLALCDSTSADAAIRKIVARGYRKIDVGHVGQQRFLGAVGFGITVEMMSRLSDRKRPRLAMGWGKLGAEAAEAAQPKKMVIRLDTFRFEAAPRLLTVNLIPYLFGLPLTTASIMDDSHAELVFDDGLPPADFAAYFRRIARRKYLYGDTVKLFRGQVITLQPVQGRRLYLDGELIEIPDNVVDIHIGERQLRVYC